MSGIHVRNVRAYASAAYQGADRMFLWMFRELYDIGRWQEIEKSSDAEWTSSSNILLTLSDLAVTVAEPYKITSATGGFTSSHVGRMITLFATDNGNRSIYNISSVIDSNTLYVDTRTRAGAWSSDESGISGRVHIASDGDPFNDATSYFVMQAPAASGRSIQAHVTHNSGYEVYVKAYPYGDYLTTARATGQITAILSDASDVRFNAYFADPSDPDYYASLFNYSDAIWCRHTIGELSDVAVGDDYPGFISGGRFGLEILSETNTMTIMHMLNEADVQTAFYPAYYKAYRDLNESSKRESLQLCKRINGGVSKIFRPLVFGENTANGGFCRGRTPHSFCNDQLASYDAISTGWWKGEEHFIVPINGPNDPLPMSSSAG